MDIRHGHGLMHHPAASTRTTQRALIGPLRHGDIGNKQKNRDAKNSFFMVFRELYDRLQKYEKNLIAVVNGPMPLAPTNNIQCRG